MCICVCYITYLWRNKVVCVWYREHRLVCCKAGTHVSIPQQMPAVAYSTRAAHALMATECNIDGCVAPPLNVPLSSALPRRGLPRYGGDVTDLWIWRGAICWLTITKAKLERLTSSGPTRCLGRSSVHALNHTRHQFPHLILFWDCHADMAQNELNSVHHHIGTLYRLI